MRRIFFYLSVALLAFGIGSSVAFEFYWNTEKIVPKVKVEKFEVTESKQSSNDDSEIQTIEDSEDKVCSGISQDDIFEPVIKKWLKGKKIKEKLTSPGEDYEAFGKFVPKLLDVNSDGKQELQIKSDCLLNGSCYYCIYQKVEGDYKNIFFPMYKIQTVEFGDKNSKGYREIKTVAKADDNKKYVAYFNFDGQFYSADKCFESSDESEQNLTSFACSDLEEKLDVDNIALKFGQQKRNLLALTLIYCIKNETFIS